MNPEASDGQVLAVARMSAIVGGVAAVFLAVVLASVIQALTVFYALLGVSLFVPVVAGIYSKRPGVPEALAAVAAGVLALVVSALTPGGPLIPGLTPTPTGADSGRGWRSGSGSRCGGLWASMPEKGV